MVHNLFTHQDTTGTHCFYRMRDLFDYLPLSNRDAAPIREYEDPVDRQDEALDTLVPSNPNIAYDMREVINRVNGLYINTTCIVTYKLKNRLPIVTRSLKCLLISRPISWLDSAEWQVKLWVWWQINP